MTTAGFGQAHYATASGSGTSLNVTVSSTTSNNLVVVNCVFTSTTPSSVSVTDNASTPNTYVQAVTAGTTGTGGGAVMYQFYGVQTTGGSTTVTVNWTTSSSLVAYVEEFSGGAPLNSAVFDKATSVVQGTSSSSLAVGSFAPSSCNELVVACYAFTTSTATTASAGLNYNLASAGTSVTSGVEFRVINNPTETGPMSITNARPYTGVVAVYQLAPINGLALLGNFSASASVSTSVSFPGVATPSALLFAFASHNSSAAFTTPAGYTALAGTTFNSSGNYAGAFYKIAAGNETSLSTSITGTTFITVLQIAGINGSTPTDGTAGANSGSSTVITTPGITTTNPNDVIISAVLGTTSNPGASWSKSTLVSVGGSTGSIGVDVVSSTQAGFTDSASWGSPQAVACLIQAFQASAPPSGEMGVLGTG